MSEIVELGLEGLDKISSHVIDRLPNEAMHRNYYHPNRLKNIGHPPRKDGDGAHPPRDRDTHKTSAQAPHPRSGDYQSKGPRSPPTKSSPSYPTQEIHHDAYGGDLHKPRGNPVKAAGHNTTSAPDPWPKTYPPPDEYTRPPPPHDDDASLSSSSAERGPRRPHRRHKKHHRARSNQDMNARYRSPSPSQPSARPRNLRRASSMDALPRPERRVEHGKRESAKPIFSQTSRVVAGSALGAVVGGVAAREAQLLMVGDGNASLLKGNHRDGKGASGGGHNWMLTLLGAAVGGMGANALMEQREEALKKERAMLNRKRSVARGLRRGE